MEGTKYKEGSNMASISENYCPHCNENTLFEEIEEYPDIIMHTCLQCGFARWEYIDDEEEN